MKDYVCVAKDFGGFISVQTASSFEEAYEKFKEFNPHYKFVDIFITEGKKYYEVANNEKGIVSYI